MFQKYSVTGMTCEGCASRLKNELSKVANITSVSIDLNKKEAEIEMSHPVDINMLNLVLKKAGHYSLNQEPPVSTRPSSSIQEFIPLIIIFTAIILMTIFKQWFNGSFNSKDIMADFMGFFFVIFGGFKIINWRGFVESYRTYDILASRSQMYGYFYPVVELTLGFSYLCRFQLTIINWITLLIMGISSIGVAKALLTKRKIVCACLGAVFKLPMTKVTLMEDVLMAVMSVWMLLSPKI